MSPTGIFHWGLGSNSQFSWNGEVIPMFFQGCLHKHFHFLLSCLSVEEFHHEWNADKYSRHKRRNQNDYLCFTHWRFTSSFDFFHTVRRSALYIAIIPSVDASKTHTTSSKTFILFSPLYRLQNPDINTHRIHRNHLHRIHPMGRNPDNRICAGRKSSRMLLNIPLSASKSPSAASH